ncbi:MAG: tRNA (adenosine(37)-N6)-threonylcarbamoyltransferase complex dimerization subunit type 1 TsaB [Clostridiales bacterium]|nr:tRNA (adenosine(37)-N6)-threonylcarbamoyltransferase complex dimerization subunit type 1 TsaB [Clostridiales bacterium]
MKILAVDASTDHGAVAICENRVLLAEHTTQGKKNHSETLLPLIQQVLKEGQTTIEQVDLFACSVGPGSFTGVRMAVSLVKGLAFGSGKPCVGVSSLAALAYPYANQNALVCALLDARRGNVYNALFRQGEQIIGDRFIDLASLEKEMTLLIQKDTPVYLVGDGAAAAQAAWTLHTESMVVQPDPIAGYSVAMSAWEHYQSCGNKGKWEEANMQPAYLRPSQAERERLAAEEQVRQDKEKGKEI